MHGKIFGPEWVDIDGQQHLISIAARISDDERVSVITISILYKNRKDGEGRLRVTPALESGDFTDWAISASRSFVVAALWKLSGVARAAWQKIEADSKAQKSDLERSARVRHMVTSLGEFPPSVNADIIKALREVKLARPAATA